MVSRNGTRSTKEDSIELKLMRHVYKIPCINTAREEFKTPCSKSREIGPEAIQHDGDSGTMSRKVPNHISIPSQLIDTRFGRDKSYPYIVSVIARPSKALFFVFSVDLGSLIGPSDVFERR